MIHHKIHELERLSLEALPRLRSLRSALLSARPAIGIARPTLYTRFFQEQGFDDERPVLQRARALAHVLDHLPTPVFDGELIVGSTTEHRLGAMLYPELMGMAIWPELPNIARRAEEPIDLAGRDADLLANQIFPFWRDHTVHEVTRRAGGDPESLRLGERMVLYLLARSNGVSHVIPDFATVVHRGLDSVIAEIVERERERQAPDDHPEAAELLLAARVALSAVNRFAGRYACACAERARATDGERAAELEQLAKILSRVPARPARDLQEALQAIWLVHVALHQENSDLALSFGRLDQVLWPVYERQLDPQRAAELIGAFFVKINDHTPLVPSAARSIFGGAPTSQALTIGGLTPDGKDGVNTLTHLLLKTAEMLGLREPNLCARLHRGDQPAYKKALVTSIARTGAVPALYGDEAVVEALVAHGVSLEHARDYGLVGCVEPTSAGRSMGMTGAILFNLAAVLELTLHDGVHPLSGLQLGPATGELTSFGSFDELVAAFCRQLEVLAAHACDGDRRLLRSHAERCPTPLLSALVEGALERGRDVTRGGARYNSSGVAVVGLADVADSLTAIEQLVFTRCIIDLATLLTAIRADFDGHEKIRALLQKKAPKYGNDDPVADARVVWLVNRIAEAFHCHQHPHGGCYHVGYWTITMHTGFGKLTGALPSGRRRGAPLASGATPVAGVARRGPTASLASTAKLPTAEIANGLANNHKLPKSLLERAGKLDLFTRLVEVYFRRGGMQVQFTIQDRETLLAAQQDPESYRDLLVRVSGYTAYFCDLDRSIQDEIIARTEDRL